MTGKQKRALRKIIIGAVIAVAVWVLGKIIGDMPSWLGSLLYLIPYAVLGYDILWDTVRKIGSGNFLDENFLMTVASIGAFACGEGMEGTAVMLFYQVGNLFESYAVGRSRKSVASLMDICPDSANLICGDEVKTVLTDEVSVGDMILVRPGEKIPLDGEITEGVSSLDTAALTGESLPRDVFAGDAVCSGCVNLTGTLRIRVTKPAGESTASKIMELVENASSVESKSEKFITRFARIYTPAVVGGAILLAIIPPIFVGDWWSWIHRALIFLVVSCPCALVISVPLSFFGGIGSASAQGVLIKGSQYMETLAQAKLFLFDKTGTLTRGTFSVTEVHAKDGGGDDLLFWAGAAERDSLHPIARCLRESAGEACREAEVRGFREIAGHGIRATVNGHEVCAGNARMMASNGLTADQPDNVGTAVHVSLDGKYLGYILVNDTVKPSAPDCIRELHRTGARAVMLTGDRPESAEKVARELNLDAFEAGLLPGDKLEKAEALMKTAEGATVYVGDGINDAPVLSRADVGVAMGAMGSDAAIEAADIVLMNDDPEALVRAVRIAHKTIRAAKQNIAFALTVKAAILILSALGLAGMWSAVFADVGVSVLAILNAMRVMRYDAMKDAKQYT